MEKGEIIERGTHQELLSADGKYREIYELQLRPQEEVMRDIDVSGNASLIENKTRDNKASAEVVKK